MWYPYLIQHISTSQRDSQQILFALPGPLFGQLTSKHCNIILNTTNNGCLPASLFPQLDSIVQSTSHRTAGRKYSP